MTRQRKTWAVVRTRFKGIHCWPSAPNGAYEFLRNPHRHEFHVTVWIEQFHDDRDIEYLEFKDWLDGNIKAGNLDHLSCEMMARRIIEQVELEYSKNQARSIRVEVSEDGENGALIE
jgi:hypothetical protein